jgi:hypothetical protein
LQVGQGLGKGLLFGLVGGFNAFVKKDGVGVGLGGQLGEQSHGTVALP